MYTMFIRKGVSKKGNTYIGIYAEDMFGQMAVTFDLNIIMRLSGYSAAELCALPNGVHKFKEV